MLDKLITSVEKELKEIGEQGLNANNLKTAKELVDMYKDLQEVECGGNEYDMRNYRRKEYPRGRYYVEGEYGAQNEDYRTRGGRSNYDIYNRMRQHLDRIGDGIEMYDYGRERYQHGDSEERVYEGLEKMMYAICMFVESAMDFAESPEEKDIIRRHISKLNNM